MNKKTIFIFKYKKIYKIILYLLLFITTIFLVYFSIPKFFNYTSVLVEESLKKNSNLNIKNISSINYRILPSPRLRIYGSKLEIEKKIFEVEDAEIVIVLNPLKLISYKKLEYTKLLIIGGLTNVKINNVNQLFNYIKKTKKRIKFKKNTIIALQENKKLFKIDNSIISIYFEKDTQQLSIEGLLLDHKISFFLKNKSNGKNNIIFKIPKLDISTNILLEKNNNFKLFKGLVNFEVQNNFFQFNFIKEKNIKIIKGFVRNNLINLSFGGDLFFKPHFHFSLDIKPSKAEIEKLFLIIKKNYFSEGSREPEMIKKINGYLNLKTIHEGNIIFENGEILFKDFKIGNNTPILFNGKISEFGKKGKVQFTLLKDIQYKKKSIKELKISGFIIPFSSEVIFEQVLIDEKILSLEKIKNYEEKFNSQVINNSLSNFFNNEKINSFFKNFDN